MEEILEVTTRKKFQGIFSSYDIIMMINLIRKHGESVNITSEVTFSKDPYDGFLLALAKDGKADFLITGDRALVELEEFSGTRIVGYADFIELLTN
jgi:putative PIN family toxin of toxin-antitoxin system